MIIGSIFLLDVAAFIALAIAFLLCIASALVVYLMYKKVNKRTTKSHDVDIESRLDPHNLASIFVASRQVKDYIKTQVRSELSKLIDDPNEKFVYLITDNVYERIVELEKLNQKEKDEISKESIIKQPSAEEPTVEIKNTGRVYFASALDENDNKTFYNVSDIPVPGETIFKFTELKNGKCEFEIYEEAFSKVLKVTDFLTGACKIDRVGTTKVIVKEKGIAEITIEGKWVVKEQAKVKFE